METTIDESNVSDLIASKAKGASWQVSARGADARVTTTIDFDTSPSGAFHNMSYGIMGFAYELKHGPSALQQIADALGVEAKNLSADAVIMGTSKMISGITLSLPESVVTAKGWDILKATPDATLTNVSGSQRIGEGRHNAIRL